MLATLGESSSQTNAVLNQQQTLMSVYSLYHVSVLRFGGGFIELSCNNTRFEDETCGSLLFLYQGVKYSSLRSKVVLFKALLATRKVKNEKMEEIEQNPSQCKKSIAWEISSLS